MYSKKFTLNSGWHFGDLFQLCSWDNTIRNIVTICITISGKLGFSLIVKCWKCTEHLGGRCQQPQNPNHWELFPHYHTSNISIWDSDVMIRDYNKCFTSNTHWVERRCMLRGNCGLWNEWYIKSAITLLKGRIIGVMLFFCHLVVRSTVNPTKLMDNLLNTTRLQGCKKVTGCMYKGFP